MPNSDLQQRKRELHTLIGRNRRRINDRLHAAKREGRRLLSWREYVTRYPSYAVLAAFGVGLAASGGLRPGWLLRRMGMQAARQTAEYAGRHLWQEIQMLWSQSGTKP